MNYPLRIGRIINEQNEPKKHDIPRNDKNNTSFFDVRKPRYNYDDLILPDNVLHDLNILQSMIENHNLIYNVWGLNKIDPYGDQVAFNLYGPPGTGKTMIVEALCNRWGKTTD